MSYSEYEFKFYDDPLIPSEDSDREDLCPVDPFDISKPTPFIEVKQNLYLTENAKSCSRKEKKNKRLECACIFDPAVDKPEEACGENCLNRMMMIECTSKCKLFDFCTNKQFQKTLYSPTEVFRTDCKGWGLRATRAISSGSFIMEYCGEVCSLTEFGERKRRYEQERRRHYYFMSLSADEIIDATKMGNYSRFINHSCEPNAETQKWNVCGQIRVGFFAVMDIAKHEEVTFDYQYERFTSSKMQKCFCGSKNCRGYLGAPKDGKPDTTRKPKTTVKKKITPPNTNEHIIQPANTIVYINALPIKSDATTSNGLQQVKLETVETPKTVPNEQTSVRSTRNTLKNGESEHCSSSITPPEPVKSEEQIFEEKLARIMGKESELCTEKQVISLISLMQKIVNNFHLRQQLLKILHKSDKSMLKKFVANHGMQVLCTWMLQAPKNALGFRDACLKILAKVQISYRIIQEQPKLVNIIEQWARPNQDSSENLVSTTTGGNSTSPESVTQNSNSSNNAIEDCQEVEKFNGVTTQQVEREATKIWEKWRSICSVYTVPKKEKISQIEELKSEEKLIVTEKESKREETKKRASKEKEHDHGRETEKSKDHEREKNSEKSRHRERREERDKNRHHSSTSSYAGKSEKKHKSHHHHSIKDKHNRSKRHHLKPSKKYTRNESNASETSNVGTMRTTPVSSPHSVTSEEKDVTPCTPTVKLLSKVIKKEGSLGTSKTIDLHIPKKPHPIVTQDPVTSKSEMETKTSSQNDPRLSSGQNIPQTTTNNQQKRSQTQDDQPDYKRPKKTKKPNINFPSNFKQENSEYFPTHQSIITPTEEFFAPDSSFYYKFNESYTNPPIGYPIPVQTVSVNTSLQLPPTVLSAKSEKLPLLATNKTDIFAHNSDREPPPPGIAPPLPPTEIPTEIVPPPPPPLPQDLSVVLSDPNLASLAKSLTEQPLALSNSNHDPTNSLSNLQSLTSAHLTQANSLDLMKSNELLQSFQTIQRHIPTDNVTQQILLAVLMQSMMPKIPCSINTPSFTLPTITDNSNLLSSLISALNPIQTQQNIVPNHLQEINALTTTLFNSQPSPIDNPLSFLTNPALSLLLSQQKQQQQQQQQQQQLQLQQLQAKQTIPTIIAHGKESDPPPPPPPLELPQNWKEATDSNGKPYYYNAMTRETQWERPVETNAFYHSPIRPVSNASLVENYSPTTPVIKNHQPLVPGTDPITPNSDVISPSELFDKEKCLTDFELRRENFKQRVSRHVINILGDYRKPECKHGRISATEDFKYLARKLTYAIIEKETNRKGLDNELLFNESVKAKANEFVRSYMRKFGPQFKRASTN